MIAKLIVWLQLFSALLLLSDAYLSSKYREALDNKLKAKVGDFSETYRAKYLKRDAKLFGLFLALCAVFAIVGVTGGWLGSVAGHLGLLGVAIIIVWAIAFLFTFSTAMAAFTERLDNHLNLLIKFPLCFALYKSPKGPIYALGFGLLVISYAVQLVVEYHM